MLTTVMAAVLAFSPAQGPDTLLIHEIPIANVTAVNMGNFLGTVTLDLFAFLSDGGVVLVIDGFYAIEGDNLCIYQSPGGTTPVVFETSWIDIQRNVHKVITDCTNFPTLEDCAKLHRKALKIMATFFPQSGISMIPLPIDGEDGRDGR